jgi:hypothetical protein
VSTARRLVLASLLAAAPVLAQAPGRDDATRGALRRLCTELTMPCDACGKHRGPGTPAPTARPANDPLRHPTDAWGHPVQISVGGDGIVLRSPGADGTLGTADDLVESCGKN